MEDYRPYKFRVARAGPYAVAYGYRPAGAQRPFPPARVAAYNPFRRPYSRRRYRTSGRGYTRRVGMYGRFGTGRSRGAQIEKKFWDTALVLGASAGVASVSQVTGQLNRGLAQGTSANTRIGQKIVIKSIQVKGTVTLAAGTGVTTWAGAGTAGTAKSFAMGTQYSAASVIKVAANSYRVIGAVA